MGDRAGAACHSLPSWLGPTGTLLPRVHPLHSAGWAPLGGQRHSQASTARDAVADCPALSRLPVCRLALPAEREHRVPEDVARLYFRDMCRVGG